MKLKNFWRIVNETPQEIKDKVTAYMDALDKEHETLVPVKYFCKESEIEDNAKQQLERYSRLPHLTDICAFTDVHYCAEKAIPVGVAFSTKDFFYPLVTGKDVGCGVMYLKIPRSSWLKPFDKHTHYNAFERAHRDMTDDGLGGGNHFLAIEEDSQNIYIICHTGSRNLGIELFQHNYDLTKKYSREHGSDVEYIDLSFLDAAYYSKYENVLKHAIDRRKQFVLKSLMFLQQANYISCNKSEMPISFLKMNIDDLPLEGKLFGTPYKIEDSIHNHIRFHDNTVIHRKGSTELKNDGTVVIPLSMSRGSIFVSVNDWGWPQNALFSCSHGAGRKLSRFDAMKYWRTTLKEKERKAYKDKFSELLDRSGNFPSGYIQEFDYAYKDSSDILEAQPHIYQVTHTTPVVTVKYTEI